MGFFALLWHSYSSWKRAKATIANNFAVIAIFVIIIFLIQLTKFVVSSFQGEYSSEEIIIVFGFLVFLGTLLSPDDCFRMHKFLGKFVLAWLIIIPSFFVIAMFLYQLIPEFHLAYIMDAFGWWDLSLGIAFGVALGLGKPEEDVLEWKRGAKFFAFTITFFGLLLLDFFFDVLSPIVIVLFGDIVFQCVIILFVLVSSLLAIMAIYMSREAMRNTLKVTMRLRRISWAWWFKRDKIPGDEEWISRLENDILFWPLDMVENSTLRGPVSFMMQVVEEKQNKTLNSAKNQDIPATLDNLWGVGIQQLWTFYWALFEYVLYLIVYCFTAVGFILVHGFVKPWLVKTWTRPKEDEFETLNKWAKDVEHDFPILRKLLLSGKSVDLIMVENMRDEYELSSLEPVFFSLYGAKDVTEIDPQNLTSGLNLCIPLLDIEVFDEMEIENVLIREITPASAASALGEIIGPKVLGYLLEDGEEDESVKDDEDELSFEETSDNQGVIVNIDIQHQEFNERVEYVAGGDIVTNGNKKKNPPSKKPRELPKED